MNDSKGYRIPSLITTQKGTVIAGIDARLYNQQDNPNKINICIRRSEDNGNTWSPIQTVVAFPDEKLDSAAAVDSSLLQDEETGTIWLMYCHTPGGIGLWNSEPSVGFDLAGQRQLYDNKKQPYELEENGEVRNTKRELSRYTVDGDGSVFINGRKTGHIFEKIDESNKHLLVEASTSFLQLVKSEDDGKTWSKPIEVNPHVKEDWMRFIGTGPGRGIQIKNGIYKGRLVFPIYFSNESGRMSNAVAYSDDHGINWKRGSTPNDGREVDGKILSAKTLTEETYELTESQVIEHDDGTVECYVRNHFGNGTIARAVSENGGETWGQLEFVEDLINPVCQTSVLTIPNSEKETTSILFLGAHSKTERKKGTIQLSEDSGKAWAYKKMIEPGAFSYSCMTLLKNNDVGIVYETQDEEGMVKIVFKRMGLEWIKNRFMGKLTR